MRTTHDRFDGQIIVEARLPERLRKRAGTCGRPEVIFAGFIPSDGEPVATVSLLTRCRHWTYARCHDLDAIADGKRIALSEEVHDGTVHSYNSVSESVYARLSLSELESVAASDVVEVRLCDTEILLTAPELATLREFQSEMARLTAPAEDGEKEATEPPAD